MKKIAFLVFAIVMAVTPAFADTLFVPFFRDGFSGGNEEGFIALQNASTTDVTVTLCYLAADGVAGPQAPATFFLEAGGVVSWRPVATSGSEGGGSVIPNMTVHTNWVDGSEPGAGSIAIKATQKLSGRYLERNLVTGLTAMYALHN